MTAAVVADPQYGRLATDEDRARWVRWDETLRNEPEILTYVQREDPDLYRDLLDELAGLAIEATSEDWRTPGLGGRAEQLIPGTVGSFSDRTDWATWLLIGGRGSGKSRTGAEAVREMLLGRRWHEPDPYFALVGKRLDDVRVNMVQNTLLRVLPPGSVQKWNRSTVELWLRNRWGQSIYVRGFSSEAPDNLRGPNLIGAWGDEVASWTDAKRSPAALDTTLSNLRNAIRMDDGGSWLPRLILTTTPKPVPILRNPDLEDELNPGLGIYDMPETVISHMSTLANLDHLSPHFLKTVVEPLKGTRLYRQEILGELIDAAKGAMWSPELIEKMRKGPAYPMLQGGGIVRVCVGVDPSIGDGSGDECGIIVAALCRDGNAYVIADYSLRAHPNVWIDEVKKAVKKHKADAVVIETQYNALMTELLGRDAPNLPLVEVSAKRGKDLRAEPVALLSDRGKARLAGTFGRLEYQLRTWVKTEDEYSPDRLDAFVYAMLWLLPVGGFDDLVKINRRRGRR